MTDMHLLYQTKPYPVKALQWTGGNYEAAINFLEPPCKCADHKKRFGSISVIRGALYGYDWHRMEHIDIATGTWIVRSGKKAIYYYSDEEFTKRYERRSS